MEREAKFYISDLPALETQLQQAGAVLVQPRTHEINLRFDTPNGTLTRNAQVLRLRRDTANRLTFKGPQRVRNGVGERVEIEFTVGEFDNAQKLLEALGYQISMIYEKYRTIYDLDGTLVTLDHMPFGDFAEIEGSDGSSIRAVCERIGLLWEARTLQSYALLFEVLKQNLGLTFRDLTFENFAETNISPLQLKLFPADQYASK